MEKKSTKKEATQKESKKKSSKKKHRGVIPYVSKPLIYVLISLIIVLPAFIGFTNKAVDIVRDLQNDLVIDYSDRAINTESFDNKTLVYEKDRIGLCEKVGVIKCEKVGIVSDVYYGVNRVSMRNGVGLSNKSTFDSFRSNIYVAGYSSRAFKGLSNVSEGDKITFETTDKIYEYTVESNTVGMNTTDDISYGLILTCDDESKSFSTFTNERRYVFASYSSMADKKGE